MSGWVRAIIMSRISIGSCIISIRRRVGSWLSIRSISRRVGVSWMASMMSRGMIMEIRKAR